MSFTFFWQSPVRIISNLFFIFIVLSAHKLSAYSETKGLKYEESLSEFIKLAEKEFRENYSSNEISFLQAVRRSQITWDIDEKVLADLKLSQELKGRFELTSIESPSKLHFVIKFAPQDSSQNYRLLFYNTSFLKSEGRARGNDNINPLEGEALIYHSRILQNTKRNVWIYDFAKHNANRNDLPILIQAEPLFKNGKLNFGEWLKVFKTAKYVSPTKSSFILGLVSATGQAAISFLAFQQAGSSIHFKSMAITWVYVAVLCTFGKTYGQLVRSSEASKEIFMRFLIGLPLSISLTLAHGSDLSDIKILLSVLAISLGDKFASFIYSFIPMRREEYGATQGKRVFGFANRSLVEREITAWFRMALQQFALAEDIDPTNSFHHWGKLLVWASAIPMYFIDLAYVRANQEEFPKLKEDLLRLKSWMNPKTYMLSMGRSINSACQKVLSSLSARLSSKKIYSEKGIK